MKNTLPLLLFTFCALRGQETLPPNVLYAVKLAQKHYNSLVEEKRKPDNTDDFFCTQFSRSIAARVREQNPAANIQDLFVGGQLAVTKGGFEKRRELYSIGLTLGPDYYPICTLAYLKDDGSPVQDELLLGVINFMINRKFCHNTQAILRVSRAGTVHEFASNELCDDIVIAKGGTILYKNLPITWHDTYGINASLEVRWEQSRSGKVRCWKDDIEPTSQAIIETKRLLLYPSKNGWDAFTQEDLEKFEKIIKKSKKCTIL